MESALRALSPPSLAELGVKAGALVQPCRVACTGRLVGPSLYHLLDVLGWERVGKRLARVGE